MAPLSHSAELGRRRSLCRGSSSSRPAPSITTTLPPMHDEMDESGVDSTDKHEHEEVCLPFALLGEEYCDDTPTRSASTVTPLSVVPSSIESDEHNRSRESLTSGSSLRKEASVSLTSSLRSTQTQTTTTEEYDADSAHSCASREYMANSLLRTADSNYLDTAASMLLFGANWSSSTVPHGWDIHHHEGAVSSTNVDVLTAPISNGTGVNGAPTTTTTTTTAIRGGHSSEQSNEPQRPQLSVLIPGSVQSFTTVPLSGTASKFRDWGYATTQANNSLDCTTVNQSHSAVLWRSSHGTILPVASSGYWQNERRMASLAGATVNRLSPTSFRISIDLAVDCTVSKVIEVIGNPDRLPLWYDAVTAATELPSSSSSSLSSSWSTTGVVVISRSSEEEGSSTKPSTATTAREVGRATREGEWIEATTTKALVSPFQNSAVVTVHQTFQNVKQWFGFPSYGRIVMFVEPSRAQVGFTIGPFPGGVNVSHTITVQSVAERKVRITNTVQLQCENEEEDVYCGCWTMIRRLFQPTLEAYMDQTLCSMARLRFVVEQGDEMIPGGYEPPSSPNRWQDDNDDSPNVALLS